MYVDSTSQRPSDIFATVDQSNTCEFADEPLTAKLTVWAAAVAATDPHLAAVLMAWETLSEAIKVRIVAIVKAALATPSDSDPTR